MNPTDPTNPLPQARPTPAAEGSTPTDADSLDTRHEQFLRFYTLHQRQIHGYIATFIYSQADVNEVAQETSIILWRKFDQFTPGGSFLAWACGVARYEVYRFLRSKRHAVLPLDDKLMETISDEREQMHEELESRREALEVCLSKLREDDRSLISRCYGGSTSFKHAAEELGRPINSVYKSLGRIRNTLLICIKSTLGLEGVR